MGEAFVEPTAAIIYFLGAKVTQLWMGVAEPVKTTCMTTPTPSDPARPVGGTRTPTKSVRKSSTEQGD